MIDETPGNNDDKKDHNSNDGRQRQTRSKPSSSSSRNTNKSKKRSKQVSWEVPKNHHTENHDEEWPAQNYGHEQTPLLQQADDTNANTRRASRHDLSAPTRLVVLQQQESALSAMSTTSSATTTTAGGGRGWKTLRKFLAQGDLVLKLKEQEETSAKKKRTRSSIRRQVFHEVHSGRSFTMQQCLIAIVGYICASVLLFSFFLEPEWTIIDSSYFAVTTFTTLGYGDLTPTSKLSRFFTCAYALLGVITLGLALGVLGNQLIEKHQHAKHQAQEYSKYQLMSLFRSDEECRSEAASDIALVACNDMLTSSSSSRKSSFSNNSSNESVYRSVHRRSSIYENKKVDFSRLRLLLIFMLGLAYWIGRNSGYDILDTIYYLIITGSTIGYGDITPNTQEARFLAIFFIPLACGVTGYALGLIANKMIDNKEQEFMSRYKTKDLTQDDIDAMDTNGDGKVSWAEFLEFMLIAMDKIDYELLDELQFYFQRLDVCGSGELSRDDLVEMTRRKLQSPRRKLELSAYKQELLEKAHHARQRQSLLKMAWLPQLFRRHDAIRQPWRNHGETAIGAATASIRGILGLGLGGVSGTRSDGGQSSMSAAAAAAAAALGNGDEDDDDLEDLEYTSQKDPELTDDDWEDPERILGSTASLESLEFQSKKMENIRRTMLF